MKKRSHEKKKDRLALTLLFAVIIFLFILTTMIVVTVVILICLKLDLFSLKETPPSPQRTIIMMAIGSVTLGAVLSGVLSRIPLKPINNIINAMNSLASGDFKTRLEFNGKLHEHPTALEIADSFNHMAEELEKTEMLRTDFVNNFSHEFKTPIVSIAGFADLLMESVLSEEDQAEYIRIISEESHRLADMATNVMNLTKVENQVILTDVVRFNLSEQIRSSILLLENKWTEKELKLETDFEDYYYNGNKELLKQVWVNLVDNAVKFSDQNGILRVSISETPDNLIATVSNTGKDIPEDCIDNIFNKFYQVDESHATPGNGIGLSVVKAIVELHGGSVVVSSKGGMTVFSVVLPK